VHEVASSTHSHAAHARPHAARHTKAQSGSDFAAMLDEMAPPKPDAPDTATPGQAPAGEQKPDAVVKAGDTGSPTTSVTPSSVPTPTSVPTPAAETLDPDQQLKAACLDCTNPLPVDPKLADKQTLLSPGEPKPEEKTDGDGTKQPVVTDKSDLPTALIQTSTTTPAASVAPTAVPAQPVVTAAPTSDQAKPSDDTPVLASVTASVLPAARQLVADAKPTKQSQAPAQPDTDDHPQGVAAPEQGAPLLGDAKPAVPAAILQTADKASAPAHRLSLELASDKSDAPQTFEDLLNAPTAQTNAGASNGSAGATANQAASAPAAAASNTPAPQTQLGPVPLSGIPVLIASKAVDGSNHFDIRLDPPELGRIEVRLKVDRDGQVSSHLIADRADTLALLRRDQTGLERALQDAGLKTTGDGLQFSLRDQGGNGQPDGRAASPSLIVQDNPLPDLPARGYVAYSARAGGIDIHV